MNIIGIYITTVIVSFIMEIKREFEIIKDVADLGYKFNTEKTVELSKELDTGVAKISYLKLLVPVYNLMVVLKNYEDYYDKREHVYKAFETMGIIEEMSNIEKREYNKKRTGMHALVVQSFYKVRLQKAIKIKLPDGSSIWYEYEENKNKSFKDNIIILKVEGRSVYLSEDEQKRQVEEVFQVIANKIIENFKNTENFAEEFLKKNEININNNNQSIEINIDGIFESLSKEKEDKHEETVYSIDEKLESKCTEYRERTPYNDDSHKEKYSDIKKKIKKR